VAGSIHLFFPMNSIQQNVCKTPLNKELHYDGGPCGMKATGIVLIIVGVIALIYGGITYTTHKKVLDMGPIQAEKKETHNIPLPPVLGVIAIVGGGALLVFSSKSR
jgi:uncharacterized membrane protein YidH (DUF202 family)